MRTREQLPWRLTTTTTYKNHQGNRENICKKEMMNQKRNMNKRGNEERPPPACGGGGASDRSRSTGTYKNPPMDNNLASTFTNALKTQIKGVIKEQRHESRERQKSIIWLLDISLRIKAASVVGQDHDRRRNGQEYVGGGQERVDTHTGGDGRTGTVKEEKTDGGWESKGEGRTVRSPHVFILPPQCCCTHTDTECTTFDTMHGSFGSGYKRKPRLSHQAPGQMASVCAGLNRTAICCWRPSPC